MTMATYLHPGAYLYDDRNGGDLFLPGHPESTSTAAGIDPVTVLSVAPAPITIRGYAPDPAIDPGPVNPRHRPRRLNPSRVTANREKEKRRRRADRKRRKR